MYLDLSNSRAAHFGLWLGLKKDGLGWAGTAQLSTVAGRAGTALKEQAMLGRGCQLVCHEGQLAIPAYRVDYVGQPTHYANSHFFLYKIVNNTPLNNYITVSLRGKKVFCM